MERLALRAVLLTVVAANVFRSEASGSKAEPDFTVTITEKGVQEDMQQFFSLGPSATLRVVDESNSAILLPQAEGGEAQDSVAYEFENGHCNFGKTIAYKDMFSGYTQQVWTRSPAEAGTGEQPGGKTSIYTFTNPPVEYLNGGVSFCVRFMTKSAVTTTTTTTTPTTTTAATAQSSAPTEGSSSDSTANGDSTSGSSGDGGSPDGPDSSGSPSTEPSQPIKPKPDQSPDVEPQPEEPQPSPPQQPPQESTQPKPPTPPPAESNPNEEGTPGVHEDEDGADEEDGQDASDHPSNSSGSPHQGGTGPGGQEQTQEIKPDGATSGPNHSEQDLPDYQKPGGTPGLEPPNPAGGKVPSDNNKLKPPRPSETPALQNTRAPTPNIRSANFDAPSRMRRLSVVDASEVKYLTIVVHSAAWGFVAKTLSLSAALFSVGATVLASN